MTDTQEGELLALIGSEPQGFTSIELQKLFFAYGMDPEGLKLYDFMPFKQGCYSFTLDRDVHALEFAGLTRQIPQERGKPRWCLTEAGRITAFRHHDSSRRMTAFRRRYPLKGKALVADTYRRYPYFAICSEIADIVLADDPVTLQRIEDARPTGLTPLATIGYEGRSIEGFFNTLIENGITSLCDVRKNPVSRKYGFSKSTLEKACQGTNIEYSHYPELGIPSHERSDLRCQADYDELFARYRVSILKAERNTVAAIAERVANGEKVALMCFEKDPAQCHRTEVAAAVARMLNAGFEAL